MRDINAYETLAVLGSGQFGSVVLVRRNSDRKLFAAKIPHGEDATACQTARQEAQLLMRLHHVNIIQFVALIEDDEQLALVMEYASGGDLDAFLRWQQESTGDLSEPAIMRIFIQIVLALQYLHGHRILHRDLKPKNILLDGDGVVKLSDFGVSKMLKSASDCAQTITGTPHYMAPELLEGSTYDSKSDIWSVGCVLHELATFSPPFSGSALGAVVGTILHCEPPPISQQYSAEFRALVCNLLEKDPSRRPDLSDILKCDAVQHHMMQLVSVATSHQPMLLEHFSARNINHGIAISSELVSPLAADNSHHIDDTRCDQVMSNHLDATCSKPSQPEARQLFFENQAAARRNKKRIDQERSCAAVFLDCDAANSVDQRSQPTAEKLQSVSEALNPSRALSPPAPSRLRAQSPPSNYEELLNAERRRVQLETKALQERMRAMQTTDYR